MGVDARFKDRYVGVSAEFQEWFVVDVAGFKMFVSMPITEYKSIKEESTC